MVAGMEHEDQVSLYEGLLTTRAIRRYTDEKIPDDALRDILFATTRAPSGSNRQPFRFVVLSDGPVADEAKRLIGIGAKEFWAAKKAEDGYDRGSGTDEHSPKARMARTMQHYVDTFESVPVLVLACYVRYRRHTAASDGASVFPACQNLLLAARSLGYGGVLTGSAPLCRYRTACPAPPARGSADHGHHHAGAPPRTPWPGAPPAHVRAGVRGSLGRGAGVGPWTPRARDSRRPGPHGPANTVGVLRHPPPPIWEG